MSTLCNRYNNHIYDLVASARLATRRAICAQTDRHTQTLTNSPERLDTDLINRWAHLFLTWNRAADEGKRDGTFTALNACAPPLALFECVCVCVLWFYGQAIMRPGENANRLLSGMFNVSN